MKIPILDTAERDKLGHALAGVVMFAGVNFIVAFFAPQYAQIAALAVASVIGILKEVLYDARTQGRHVELADALFTIGGAVLGLICSTTPAQI
ncbi:MAG: hypothetical protein ACE5F7_09310, partial [Nitrospiria bacterium]